MNLCRFAFVCSRLSRKPLTTLCMSVTQSTASCVCLSLAVSCCGQLRSVYMAAAAGSGVGAVPQVPHKLKCQSDSNSPPHSPQHLSASLVAAANVYVVNGRYHDLQCTNLKRESTESKSVAVTATSESAAVAAGTLACPLCIDVTKALSALDAACSAALKALNLRRACGMSTLALYCVDIFEHLSSACASLYAYDTLCPHTGRSIPAPRKSDANNPLFVGVCKLTKAPLDGELGVKMLSSLVGDMQRRARTERADQLLVKAVDVAPLRSRSMQLIRSAFEESETLHRAVFRLANGCSSD